MRYDVWIQEYLSEQIFLSAIPKGELVATLGVVEVYSDKTIQRKDRDPA